MILTAHARDAVALRAVADALFRTWVVLETLSFDDVERTIRMSLGLEETRNLWLLSSSSAPKLLTHDLVIGLVLEYRVDHWGAAGGPQPFESLTVSGDNLVLMCGFGTEIVARVEGVHVDVVQRYDPLHRRSRSQP
jgi:hypothetical protein